jgi:hypothetical protein
MLLGNMVHQDRKVIINYGFVQLVLVSPLYCHTRPHLAENITSFFWQYAASM